MKWMMKWVCPEDVYFYFYVNSETGSVLNSLGVSVKNDDARHLVSIFGILTTYGWYIQCVSYSAGKKEMTAYVIKLCLYHKKLGTIISSGNPGENRNRRVCRCVWICDIPWHSQHRQWGHAWGLTRSRYVSNISENEFHTTLESSWAQGLCIKRFLIEIKKARE